MRGEAVANVNRVEHDATGAVDDKTSVSGCCKFLKQTAIVEFHLRQVAIGHQPQLGVFT